MLLTRSLSSAAKPIPNLQVLSDPPRLQRAIGVRYVKATERQSHYFHTTLPLQFDAMLHFDRTSHLRPLMTAARDADRTRGGGRRRKTSVRGRGRRDGGINARR